MLGLARLNVQKIHVRESRNTIKNGKSIVTAEHIHKINNKNKNRKTNHIIFRLWLSFRLFFFLSVSV
jgi:hypothetical protein